MPGTLAEKLWESHVVRRADGEPDLLYIDLHLVHDAEELAQATLRKSALAFEPRQVLDR